MRRQTQFLQVLSFQMQFQRFIQAGNNFVDGVSLRDNGKIDAFTDIFIFTFINFKLENMFNVFNLTRFGLNCNIAAFPIQSTKAQRTTVSSS